MNIAAVTRLKHGDVLSLLRQLGWSQSELAGRCGIRAGVISDYILLKKRPSAEHMLGIQKAFGEAGVFLDVEKAWPEQFVGLKKSKVIEQYRDIQPENLLPITGEVLQIPGSCSSGFDEEREALEAAVDRMRSSPKTRAIAKMIFVDRMSDGEISDAIGVGRQRINQIKNSYWRSLRREVEAEDSGENFDRMKKIEAARKVCGGTGELLISH